jgi:serine protease inhibitor
VVATLNHWADSVTAGLIREIRRDPFDTSTEVVLTNAVYFKGLWLDAFKDSLTRDRAFTSASGERTAVPTMERTGALAYRRGPRYQALRIPYRSGLSAMYVVLPDSGLSAATLLDSLTAAGWPLPDPRRDVRDVNLRLPRLHITQETDLRPPLEALGLDIIFDAARADFGGLVVERPDRPPPCPPLSSGLHSGACTRHRVSSAQQSVYLDVDEQGTQAAAVTTIEVGIVITATPAPIPFYVDRPFLFALRDERTGTFLFMGYIAAPNR